MPRTCVPNYADKVHIEMSLTQIFHLGLCANKDVVLEGQNLTLTTGVSATIYFYKNIKFSKPTNHTFVRNKVKQDDFLIAENC